MSDFNFEHLSPLSSPTNKRKLIEFLSVTGASGWYLRETRQNGVSNKISPRTLLKLDLILIPNESLQNQLPSNELIPMGVFCHFR
jgi:hypothetical protein